MLLEKSTIGSKFGLSLDAKEVEAIEKSNKMHEQATAHDRAELQGHVLVVDDSVSNHDFIKLLLKRTKLTVDYAENG